VVRQKYEFDKEFSILIQLRGEMDDSIYIIDKVLSDEHLFRLIESDLSKRYQNTTSNGRKSTPVEVVLRMLALKHLRGGATRFCDVELETSDR
jgi:transposase, IS5 family